MKIQVKVHANSSQEKIEIKGRTVFEVWLKEKPTDGKANQKLLLLMKKHFNDRDVKMISGFNGRKKLLEVIGD